MNGLGHAQKKLILVDDEQWYVEALRDALEHKGYQVIVARTGSEALSKIKDAHPDLVVLDIMMDPGELTGNHAEGRRTGRVILETIRGELGLDPSRLPVVCLTVIRDDELREAVIKLGAEFLSKEEVELSEVLRRIEAKLRAEK